MPLSDRWPSAPGPEGRRQKRHPGLFADYSDEFLWARTPLWWERARCRGLGVQVSITRAATKDEPGGEYYENGWFPERGDGAKTKEAIAQCWGTAKGLHGECPSRLKCLEVGLVADNPIGVGVWGGHSVRERRRIKILMMAGGTIEAASAQVRAVKVGAPGVRPIS